jgi:hypothetical protein
MDLEGVKGTLNVTKISCRTNYALNLKFAVIRWLKDTVYLLFANMVGSLCHVFRATKDQNSFSENLTVCSAADE